MAHKKTQKHDNTESPLGRVQKGSVNAAVANASNDIVQRHGSAIKEHVVAYSGTDHERGKTLVKGLKDISKSKLNKDFRSQNIKQQAGFSAEIKEMARENAERILREDGSRIIRTDDLGLVNDQLYDHAVLDAHGNRITGLSSQMKFVGKNEDELLGKLMSKKYEKYLDGKMEIPSDYFDGVKSRIRERLNDLDKQLDRAKQENRPDLEKRLQNKFDKLKKIDKNLEKSHVSTKDAIVARLHPAYSTAKDVMKIGHKAGKEGAKTGAMIGGGISLIRNAVAAAKGDKSIGEATGEVVSDVEVFATTGYVVASGGSILKGAMQNAPNEFVRTLSLTPFPANIVAMTLEIGKTMTRYVKGEIDDTECLSELGEKGTSSLSSAMFAAAGQIVIPIPGVGALIGGIVGYTFSSVYYKELTTALNEAKLAQEERIRIEVECAQAIEIICQYRMEIEQVITAYLSDHRAVFDAAFSGIKASLELGNVDGFISSMNTITEKLGGDIQYKSLEEFNTFMKSDDSIIL